MSNAITIGISDMQVAKYPESFVTFALGSCIGICLYDATLKIGGLGHIMLPYYPENNPKENKHRYADTCIPLMVQAMECLGSNRRKIVAKIAGGAKMFDVAGDSNFGNIGQRNIEAVKKTLASLQIGILAEDTGLNYGRTVYFYTKDGSMHVKSFAQGNKVF